MEVSNCAIEQQQSNIDDDDLPEMTEEKKAMIKKIDDILSEYYLNGVQKFAA